ncbi:MAG TPA: glutamate--tRNA ligase [Candidatus Eremiobacteraceae bacterium]|nr:glutamate--tRNA ligase [Candidatus Eremiobacteraceae bacterium]
MSSDIRVRFAPSPTGYLHVGGARTALFNWLFARHHGGRFVLRIEDTDVARNRPEYTQAIYEGLRWIKLDWDEGPDIGGAYGPYLQSERVARHLAAATQLLASGKAYECFCSQRPTDDDENDDDDSADNIASRAHSRPDEQACRCAQLSDQERADARSRGPAAIRFAVPAGRDFVVDDLIRGKVTFPGETVGDFILVTSDGRALYNLAVVVDDHAMEISHVIRGDEHLANTPKQLLLYEAFDWKPPQFAHIPIILNAQRRKLSKRDGATSLNDYEAMGYVPDAVVNFLALLGWSPRDNRELLTRDELIKLFDLDGVVKHPAIFDTAKLGWMNKEYIKAEPATTLASRVIDLMHRSNRDGAFDRAYVERVASLLHDRVRTVVDVLELGSYFFTDGAIEPTEEALSKHCAKPETITYLQDVRGALTGLTSFDTASVERGIRDLAAAKGVKASEYIHPLRVAVTGEAVSPGIFEVCAILGRDRVLARADALIAMLNAGARAHAKAAH